MSDEERATDNAQWKEVRDLLKAALLAGDIPVEPKTMRPKAVFEKFVQEKIAIDYANKQAQGKFTRMLRMLRKKHENGDLKNEGDVKNKPIEWGKSAAKQFLKKCFRDGTISTTYKTEDLMQIWNDHCKDHPAFKRIKYDYESFSRRLNSVKDDYVKKVERCKDDLGAYIAAKTNHPTPEFNSRGEPQWNGSEAQKQLKELVAKDEHIGVQPKALWEGNEHFRKYTLNSFRDHIYQEKRLLKFNRYVENLRQKKLLALQY
jgi:hypothetical protein